MSRALRPARAATPGDGDPEEAYWAFVAELARRPDGADIADKLTDGHRPDSLGWCRHPSHTHHWQQHPCPVLLLATYVAENADAARER